MSLPPSERMPGLGGEPSALTPRQARFAAMMKSDPRAAFALIEEKCNRMTSYPRKPENKTTTLRGVPVRVITHFDRPNENFDDRQVILRIPMAPDEINRFMDSCNGEGLRKDFMGAPSGEAEGGFTLRVEVFFDAFRRIAVDAVGERLIEGPEPELYRTARVSLRGAAVLLDLFEPQGIGPDLEEIDTRLPGEPASVGVEPADLVLLSPEEAELAESIRRNPDRTWEIMEERLRFLGLNNTGDENRTYIGKTAVDLYRRAPWEVTLSFTGDSVDLDQIIDACGDDGLSETLMAALARGIRGNHLLRISADFASLPVSLIAITRGLNEPVDVNPKFLAALMMRLEKSQKAESPAWDEEVGGGEVQVYPSSEPAAVAEPVVVVRGTAQDDRSRRLVGLFDRLLAKSSDPAVKAGSSTAAPQTGEKVQASPATPLTAEQLAAKQLADLMRTNPREVFAEIKRRIEGAGGGEERVLQKPRLANIGGTEVRVSMDEGSLTLDLETDYVNLMHFIENCEDVTGLSKVYKAALDRGISGSHRLHIKAELTDSGIRIRAVGRRYNGLEHVDDKSGIVSPEAFAELVVMLKPPDQTRVSQARYNDELLEYKRLHRDKNVDKKGQGHRRKKR